MAIPHPARLAAVRPRKVRTNCSGNTLVSSTASPSCCWPLLVLAPKNSKETGAPMPADENLQQGLLAMLLGMSQNISLRAVLKQQPDKCKFAQSLGDFCLAIVPVLQWSAQAFCSFSFLKRALAAWKVILPSRILDWASFAQAW